MHGHSSICFPTSVHSWPRLISLPHSMISLLPDALSDVPSVCWWYSVKGGHGINVLSYWHPMSIVSKPFPFSIKSTSFFLPPLLFFLLFFFLFGTNIRIRTYTLTHSLTQYCYHHHHLDVFFYITLTRDHYPHRSCNLCPFLSITTAPATLSPHPPFNTTVPPPSLEINHSYTIHCVLHTFLSVKYAVYSQPSIFLSTYYLSSFSKT